MTGATELLYYQDAYLAEFEAVVVAVAGDAVALDRTAFYPGGGGQRCDVGRLLVDGGSWEVVRAWKEEDLVWHEVGETPLPEAGLRPGHPVTGLLDWEHRYALMRTHTALHLLSGVVWRGYGAKVTGGAMDPPRGRMDFEFETIRQELVREIEEKCDAEVAARRPVVSRVLPREEAFAIPDLIRTKINLLPPGIERVRVVEIVGLDLQADGGTHVADTSEVGRMRVTGYKSKGRINKRIEFALEQ